jgi:hypothetical protein
MCVSFCQSFTEDTALRPVFWLCNLLFTNVKQIDICCGATNIFTSTRQRRRRQWRVSIRLLNTENNVATTNMTTKQIIEEIKGIKDAFEWRLTSEQRIQGVLKGTSDGRVFDPVTALAYFRTRKFFPEGHTSAAARSVGLSFIDSVEIVAACGYGFALGAGPGDLRRDILNAIFGESELATPATRILVERTVITH